MEERGVNLDHSTLNRWVLKYSPQLEEQFHRRKRPVWVSWRMDETYIRVKGTWVYLYRAVDKFGKTIDFLLTEQRDQQAAKRFLTKAIRRKVVYPRLANNVSRPLASRLSDTNQPVIRSHIGFSTPHPSLLANI